MNLQEPKKKKRVKLKPQSLFPIPLNETQKWPVYTAQLTDMGSCIIEPEEMKAVHSMGFFGKGSLSRNYPSFGKARYGVPPVVRNRQWLCRQKWLEEVKELNSASTSEYEGIKTSYERERENTSDNEEENNGDVIENSAGNGSKERNEVVAKNTEIDEVTLDSAEEDDICVIVNKVSEKCDTENSPITNDSTKCIERKTESEEKEGEEELGDFHYDSKNRYHGIILPLVKQGINTSYERERENTSDNKENNGDVIEILPNSAENESKEINEVVAKNTEIDEVTLDSAEENDICVIVNEVSEKCDTENSPITNDSTKCIERKRESEEKEGEEELCDFDYYDFKNNGVDDDQHGKLLVLPDSDSDTENYLKDIEPRIENEGFPIREVLHLTFEETFFLLFGLGCLQLVHFDGNFLDISNAWLYFCKNKSDFLQKYVVYHYYRSKGWVVKPGLKYGGDFLLYKQGPPFYHASYIVIVEVVDADFLIIDSTMSTRSMTWDNLFALERLSETAAKEILFAQVLWPSSVPRNASATSPEILSEFTVRELLWRRWNPKQHREDVPTEEEDEDSF